MRNEINMKTVCSLVGVEENKNYLDVNRSDALYEGQQLRPPLAANQHQASVGIAQHA